MSSSDHSQVNELHDQGTYATGVGCRVVRGPDWKWGKQDGGEGHLGSVRRFDTLGEAIVVWDSGIVANYRCGTLGFDLRVLDSAPTGIKHPGTICEGCHESPIYGIRWKCVVCLSSDLCSTCYHSDKHSLTHQFLRITAPYKTRVIVGRRLKQRRVDALGLFPKARVVRGIDWSWDSQDCVSPLTSTGSGSLLLGASGSALVGRNLVRPNGEDASAGPILLPTQGRITDRRDWYPWAPRSAALVAWDSGAYNVYRVGYAGLIDLKAIRPAKGGSFYVDHLPLLADLRGCTNEEPTRGLEETAAVCTADEDVAELCRDACGNPLVPNWTNLQELENRRRRAAGSSTSSDARGYHRTTQPGRQSSRSDGTHVASPRDRTGTETAPRITSAGSSQPEPAASSCLNVCTLASRLQMQSASVESQPPSHPQRRPVQQSSRLMVRDLDDTGLPRTSTGGLRNLGQTARSLLTDLLRSSTASGSNPVPGGSGPVSRHGVATSGTLEPAVVQGRTRTGVRPVSNTAPAARIQQQQQSCIRQGERTCRNMDAGVVIGMGNAQRTRDSSMPHRSQRTEVPAEERSRLVTLIPRAVGNHSDSERGREAVCTHLESSLGLIESGDAGSQSSNRGGGGGSSGGGGGGLHRREQANRVIYGVYNQLQGIMTEAVAAANPGSYNVGAEPDSVETERRTCQRNHCRNQVGQSNEELIRAAEEGNLKRLKCLLQHRRVNVDSKFAGATALHVACQAGHVACVAALLQFGAKRQLRDGSGNEAIHAAAQGGNVSIIRLLLTPRIRQSGASCNDAAADDNVLVDAEDTGSRDADLSGYDADDVPDVNSRNALRQTALHLAVTRHDFMVAQCLLEEFNALPNLQDCDGDSPLHDAIAGLNIRMVELLLQHNADLTITNNSGQNPLHYATVLGEANIARTILQNCLYQTPWLVDEPQPDGLTALHLASLHGHLEVTDLLLQAGADPNLTVQRPPGLTPGPVRSSTETGGVGGTLIVGQSTFTALHLAVHKAHPDVVCLLLCYGARATLRNGDGRSPMQLVLSTLAQTHDMQQANQPARRFDVALVPFLASVARLLVRMADSLTMTSGSTGMGAGFSTLGHSRLRANREEFEEQLISIDDPPEDEDARDPLNEPIFLNVPSPLCRRLKSTVQATLETGVPRLVLIAACLASAIGAESWSAGCAVDEDDPAGRSAESITESFVTDIFGECLDPVLQLALQQCHMEAMNSMSQIRTISSDGDNRSPRHHAQPGAELLVDVDEVDEVNLVDALLQADSQPQSAISLLPATGCHSTAADAFLFRPGSIDQTSGVLDQPLTIANQLVPQLNNLRMQDPPSEPQLLPPALEEIDLELRECLVCSESNRATIIIPCGHIITCLNCTSLVKKCLLCRRPISGFHEFTRCCECHQSFGVLIARPCNHMLWCKDCLKTKVRRPLETFDRIDMLGEFELTLDNADGDLFMNSVRPRTSSLNPTTTSTVRSTESAVPAKSTNPSKQPITTERAANAEGAVAQTTTNEWREVPLGKLLAMIGNVNSLLEDLMTGGLCMDGCPVCNQHVETLMPIVVSCAGVEQQQQQTSFARGPEMVNPVCDIERDLSVSNNLPCSIPLTQPSNNRNTNVFEHSHTNIDLLAATASSSMERSDRTVLDLHSTPSKQTIITPNNRLHPTTNNRPESTVRKRNSRPQLCERELSKLKHELQVMREQIRCPICLDRSRNLVFMCGHATCQWCGDQVTACPICRRAVESRIILY